MQEINEQVTKDPATAKRLLARLVYNLIWKTIFEMTMVMIAILGCTYMVFTSENLLTIIFFSIILALNYFLSRVIIKDKMEKFAFIVVVRDLVKAVDYNHQLNIKHLQEKLQRKENKNE